MRSLHALFEHEPRTVAALIRHRRLQQARTLLRDPLLGQVSVQRIGAKVGIPDAAGFSRMFSREFGLTPGRFRQQQAA